jgi:hypothetical protein
MDDVGLTLGSGQYTFNPCYINLTVLKTTESPNSVRETEREIKLECGEVFNCVT